MPPKTSSKPKILWLTSSYPRYEHDNASVFLRYLASAISKEGVELHILTPDHIATNRSYRQQNIHIHTFRYFFPRSLQKLAYGSGILPNLKANPVLFIQIPFFLISQFYSCLRLARQLKPALIHAHWVFPQGTIASLIGKILKIPVIITTHGGDAFALRGSLLSKIKCWSIKNCTAWTSNTSATARALGNDIPKPNIIPMGIDYKKFSSGCAQTLRSTIAQDTLILLFVGRLVEKKGVNDLLTAYSLLSKPQQKNTQLWIIGDGAERRALEQLSNALNINKKVTFYRLPKK